MKKIITRLTLLMAMTFAMQSHAWFWDSWFQPSTYTKTKYPIVLAHGLLGFDQLLGDGGTTLDHRVGAGVFDDRAKQAEKVDAKMHCILDSILGSFFLSMFLPNFIPFNLNITLFF